MYIGPWQEYRLAKLQDNAIKKIQKEWEIKIAQCIEGNDPELANRLLSELPNLHGQNQSVPLSFIRKHMHNFSRPNSSRSVASSTHSCHEARMIHRQEDRRTPRRSTALGSTMQAIKRPSKGNQEQDEMNSLHSGDVQSDDTLKVPVLGSTRNLNNMMMMKKKKKKKKKKRPVGETKALLEVQRRKELFKKHLSAPNDGGGLDKTNDTAVTLPRIQSEDRRIEHDLNSSLRTDQRETVREEEEESLPDIFQQGYTKPPPISLDESLDEEEVDDLLNWSIDIDKFDDII